MRPRTLAALLVMAAAYNVGCRDDRPGGHVAVGNDAGDGRAGAADVVGERAADLPFEAAPEGADVGHPDSAADARDTAPDRAADVVADVDAGADADVSVSDVRADADGSGGDAAADLPAERPAATASWTIRPRPACVAAGAGCMDTGSVGGYQITATGYCPTTSSIQIYLPGGAGAPPAGTYAVKTASGIFDVIAMPAGMAGVAVDIDDPTKGHLRYWGRSGTVTVAGGGVGGSARHVTFSAVDAREEQSGAAVLLDADVSCP